MIDTKGPEIRTCKTQNEVEVNEGQEILFSHKKDSFKEQHVCVNYNKFVNDLNEGNKILIDDGEIKITVLEKHNDFLTCRVENSGIIKKQ